MKSDQIRKLDLKDYNAPSANADFQVLKFIVLREIAAQLAELNENFKVWVLNR